PSERFSKKTNTLAHWFGSMLAMPTACLTASRYKQYHRSVAAQMILLGALSFVGPAIADAITNLGGGGLSSPFLANLANSLNYTSGCLMTLFGGPLINKLGIKNSCVIAAIAMPLTGSSYYSNARFGTTWYLLTAQSDSNTCSFAECTGLFWALNLTPTHLVRRKNGTKISTPTPTTWKRELYALRYQLYQKK
ncbi:hypothetical protein EPUL_002750, partial [Erysiphe pulchra]